MGYRSLVSGGLEKYDFDNFKTRGGVASVESSIPIYSLIYILESVRIGWNVDLCYMGSGRGCSLILHCVGVVCIQY